MRHYLVIAALSSLLGCGPAEEQPQPTNHATKFVGTWNYGAASTITTTCTSGGTQATQTQSLTGTLTITDAGDNVVNAQRGDCTTKFTASDGSASLVPGQPQCGSTAPSSGSLSLSGATLTHTQRDSGTGAGNCETLDIEVSGTLSK